MDKYIFDESNGLWYELQGDYYIPCLILSEEETQPIGLWGQRHKQYLKEHKQFLYTTMLIEGTLNSYLADIDRQAQERLLLLTKQIAEQENVTEKLKADNAMLWVQKMNEIQSRVREIIYSEIIYAFKEIPFGIEHTLKVLKNAEDIMKGENIGEEEKEFISIIAILHLSLIHI